MDYRQKFYIARELQSEADLQKDRELLAKHRPNHPLLFRSSNLSSGGKISFDIVFELLDIVSADQILENRQIREVAVIPSLISTVQEVKKKGFQKMKSFLESSGKTLQTVKFKKPN